MRPTSSCGIIFALAALATPAPATAELVVLTNGRVLSVASYEVVGDEALIGLRSGGTMRLARSFVAEVRADEVPYPPPAPPPPVGAEPEPAAASPLHALIDRLAARHGVDRALAHAVIRVESNYDPRAVSPKGAMGLMQLMPALAAHYAVEDPFDPAANVDAGLRHLRLLLDRFDTAVALAAYNAGETAVGRYGGIPPYRETRDYVRKILALSGSEN